MGHCDWQKRNGSSLSLIPNLMYPLTGAGTGISDAIDTMDGR